MHVYIWQCAIIYLPPPGGCNKIPEMCREILAACLLLYSTRLHCPSGPILECEAPSHNFVTTGGMLLISTILHVFSPYLSVFSLRWGHLYETQREATEFT